MNYIKTIFGADSTEFVKGVTDMDKAVERSVAKTDAAFAGLGKRLAGYLSFAFLAKTVNDAINYFDNLQHKAEQLGISVTFLGAVEDAMRAVGGSTQGADAALSSLMRKWGEAQTGGGELVTLLNKIGISTKNTDNTLRSSEDALYLFADAIASAQDPAEKLFISTKVFGEENGVKMVEILKNGAEGLARMRAEFELSNPEIDKHAKSLSEAKQNITDLWEGIIIFAGGFIGKVKEIFGNGFDGLIDASINALDQVYLIALNSWNKVIKTISFGNISFDKLIEESRKEIETSANLRQAEILKKQQARKANEQEINDELIEQSESYLTQLENIELLRKGEAKRAADADAHQRAIDARLEAFFGDINMQTASVANKNKEIIHALIEQGLTLDTIANRYPNLKEAIEASKTEYEKAAEAAAKIKENVDKATDATNDLADAAGRVNYGPGPGGGGGAGGGGAGGDWRNNSQLSNTGSGGGYFGTFQGMGDVSQMSAEDIIRASRELEKQLLDLKLNATKSMDFMQIEKTYIRNIEDILKKLNEELYVRAQAELGGKSGGIPKPGFLSPEQYFKKLDDFIAKLYEKETEKDTMIDKQKKSAETQVEATKKLANALDRFSGSMERSAGKGFGIGFRP